MNTTEKLFEVQLLGPDGWTPLTYKPRPLRETLELHRHYYTNWENSFYRIMEVGQ